MSHYINQFLFGIYPYIAMTAGGIFGTLCLVGMVLLIRRRLFDPRIRATSQYADLPILLFPFTRLGHAWSVPIQYLGRTGYQIVRKRA